MNFCLTRKATFIIIWTGFVVCSLEEDNDSVNTGNNTLCLVKDDDGDDDDDDDDGGGSKC